MSSRWFAREFVESAGSVESVESIESFGSIASMKAGGGAPFSPSHHHGAELRHLPNTKP